jgi:hypothetical protein
MLTYGRKLVKKSVVAAYRMLLKSPYPVDSFGSLSYF